MSTFRLTIAKVGENLFDGEVVSVLLPGSEGVFQVLAKHEPLVTPLRKGTIRFSTTEGESQLIEIEQGIAEVSNNQATILL